VLLFLVICMARQPPPPQWARASSLSRLYDHPQTHHTRYDSSGRVNSPTRRPPPDNTQHSHEISMPPLVFEPAIPACERRQAHALESAANGTGDEVKCNVIYVSLNTQLIGFKNRCGFATNSNNRRFYHFNCLRGQHNILPASCEFSWPVLRSTART